MAFGQLTITSKGQTLLAKVQAGAAMEFTRMAIGDGDIGATDPTTLLDLVNRLAWVNLSSVARTGNGDQVTATGTFNNSGVATAFYFKEIGLYADDPDDGEILFMYGSNAAPDQIPAQSSEVIERTISITVALSNSITLTVTLNPAAVALASQVTPAALLAAMVTVDGAGSGLDADLLDGNHATAFLLAANYTAADILSKLLGVDGAGSGLDADKLDGIEAAAFLLAASYTAADVLNKIKTVDGAGTGLDADLLDGNHAAAFLLAASYTAADVLNKIKTVDGSGSGLDADMVDGSHYNAADILSKLLGVDGSGSGLDADKLDGQHLSYFQKAIRVESSTPSGLALNEIYGIDLGVI